MLVEPRGYKQPSENGQRSAVKIVEALTCDSKNASSVPRRAGESVVVWD